MLSSNRRVRLVVLPVRLRQVVFVAGLLALAAAAGRVAWTSAADPSDRTAVWVETAYSPEISAPLSHLLIDPATELQESYDHRSIRVLVNAPLDPDHYVIDLRAAAGAVIEPGAVTDANLTLDGPGMSFWGAYVDCGPPYRYRVDEVTRADGAVIGLAATLRCGEGLSSTGGVLRVGSSLPMAVHSASAASIQFPTTLAATSAPDQAVTVVNNGDLALHLGPSELQGDDPTDFSIARDDCVGTTLEPGDSCAVAVRFTPADGPSIDRGAFLVTPDDSDLQASRTLLRGSIRRPTAITISSSINPNTWGQSPTFTAVITPEPDSGLISWSIDGAEYEVRPFRDTFRLNPLSGLLGVHDVTATYLGAEHYSESTSAAVTQTSYAQSSTTLTIDWQPPARDFSVHAVVRLEGVKTDVPAGTVTIVDETAGTVLATAPVSGPSTVLSIPLITFPEAHILRATHTGLMPYIQGSTSTGPAAPPVTVDDATASGIYQGTTHRIRVHAHSAVPYGPDLWFGLADTVNGEASVTDQGCQVGQYFLDCWADVEFAPDPTFIGTEVFEISASDNDGHSALGTISLTYVGDTTPPVGHLALVSADPGAASGYTGSETILAQIVGAIDQPAGLRFLRISNTGPTADGSLTVCREILIASTDWSSPFGWSLANETGGSTTPGMHTVYAQWSDIAGNWTPVEAATIVLDTEAPVGSVVIGGGATFTRSPDVAVSVAASDAISGVSSLALSNDGSHWTTRAYGSSQSWTLAGSSGTQQVWARWQDGAGNWSTAGSDTIELDAIAPTVTAPRDTLAGGARVSSGRLPVTLKWTSSDATSGVASYELQQSTDGAGYASVSTTIGSPSTTRWLATGHSYRFRVRAVDRAGNVGTWAYGNTIRLSVAQQSSSKVTYSRSWRTARSSGYWGGSERYTTVRAAKATFRFTGHSVAWIAVVGPSRGSANVYVDGVLTKRVNLHASSPSTQRIVFARSWSENGTHTITIKVLATSGHPRVDLDAFVWGM